jgi:hypothetical protein
MMKPIEIGPLYKTIDEFLPPQNDGKSP